MKKLTINLFFFLAQFADLFIEAYWLFVLMINKGEIFSYLIISGLIKVFGYFVFARVFIRNVFYIVFIYAIAFAFVMVLLINKFETEASLLHLMILKELFSVLRIVANKNYLAQVGIKRDREFSKTNVLFLVSLISSVVAIKYLVTLKIAEYSYIYFALIISLANVIAYNLPKKTKGRELSDNSMTIFINVSQKLKQKILLNISIAPIANLFKIHLILGTVLVANSATIYVFFASVLVLFSLGLIISRLEILKMRYWESETITFNGLINIILAWFFFR